MTPRWMYALAFACVVGFAAVALYTGHAALDAYRANTLGLLLAWGVACLFVSWCALRVLLDAWSWWARDAAYRGLVASESSADQNARAWLAGVRRG